jgi:hypothetical protein
MKLVAKLFTVASVLVVSMVWAGAEGAGRNSAWEALSAGGPVGGGRSVDRLAGAVDSGRPDAGAGGGVLPPGRGPGHPGGGGRTDAAGVPGGAAVAAGGIVRGAAGALPAVRLGRAGGRGAVRRAGARRGPVGARRLGDGLRGAGGGDGGGFADKVGRSFGGRAAEAVGGGRAGAGRGGPGRGRRRRGGASGDGGGGAGGALGVGRGSAAAERGGGLGRRRGGGLLPAALGGGLADADRLLLHGGLEQQLLRHGSGERHHLGPQQLVLWGQRR